MTSARFGALQLRQGVRPAVVIIFFRVEADADARADPAAAALALVAARPRDSRDRQAGGLGPDIVLGDPGQAGIDDIADAGNGDEVSATLVATTIFTLPVSSERFFAGRPPATGRKAAEPRRLRDLFSRPQAAFPDIPFGRQKNENVTLSLACGRGRRRSAMQCSSSLVLVLDRSSSLGGL